MATVYRFEDLEIWKKSKEFDKNLYHSIKDIDLIQKDFRFKSQILAVSGSVMDNIAEGFEKDNNKEFIAFLLISKGSAGEVRSQIHRAILREYISQELGTDLINNITLISQSIASFINYLKTTEIKGLKHK